MDLKVIGIVMRHDFNDYEFMLADLSEKDSSKIMDIMEKYEDKSCGFRDNRNMTLADANIDYLEHGWQTKFRCTATGETVTLPQIFQRYFEINGTYEGFEAYVNKGFRNGIEVEYVPISG